MTLEKIRKKICGANVLLPTPFKENYEIDFEALKGNVEFMLEGGLKEGNAILKPTSSDGEFALMSREEQKKVIKTVIDVADGKIPVVPGTFHVKFDRTVEVSKYAEDAGATAVMILPPPYYSENLYKTDKDDVVVNYFRALAEEISIGIMIYNQPRRNGLEITVELFERLAREIPSFIATQDCVNDSTKIFTLMRRLSGRLSINACGAGEEGAPAILLAGADGFVSNVGNLAPQYTAKIYELCREGKYLEAQVLARKLRPVYEVFDKYPAIAGLKAAMEIVGRSRGRIPRGGMVRRPLSLLKPSAVEDVKRALVSAGLVSP